MTSAITFPCLVIGLMSGTSADGVDAALLMTDGRTVAQAGASCFVPYGDDLRRAILGLMQGEGDERAIARELTQVHIAAVRALLPRAAGPVALVGFHGQTIRHDPKNGVTLQIGEPQFMADVLGVPVVADFRSRDVAEGGQGAPLVPLYHAARAHDLPKPLMVVNIGGVANVTFIQSSASYSGDCGLETVDSLLAFDCGPGNALLDDWVHRHTGARYDADGALAASGVVDEAAVTRFLAHGFFAKPAPKSLDRNEFHDVLPSLAHLSAADGAATLTAMTAAAIAQACTLAPVMPRQLLITGGGRRNPTLMRMIGERVASLQSSVSSKDASLTTGDWRLATVLPVESVGWDGDMLEAQAFAYLAARSVQGLALSLPSTTGVSQPVTGGVFYRPGCVDAS